MDTVAQPKCWFSKGLHSKNACNSGVGIILLMEEILHHLTPDMYEIL